MCLQIYFHFSLPLLRDEIISFQVLSSIRLFCVFLATYKSWCMIPLLLARKWLIRLIDDFAQSCRGDLRVLGGCRPCGNSYFPLGLCPVLGSALDTSLSCFIYSFVNAVVCLGNDPFAEWLCKWTKISVSLCYVNSHWPLHDESQVFYYLLFYSYFLSYVVQV